MCYAEEISFFVVQLVFAPERGAESSDGAIPHHTVGKGCEEQSNWER